MVNLFVDKKQMEGAMLDVGHASKAFECVAEIMVEKNVFVDDIA